MRLSYKVEVQPTPTQRHSLLQHAGNARWAWNWGLSRKKEAWEVRKAALASGVSTQEAPKVPTAVDLHRELNVLKKKSVEEGGVPWMYAASKCAPQEALRNLDTAFQHTFRRLKQGEAPGFPKFKARSRGVGGFRVTGTIRVQDRFITLPVVGRLRIKPGDRGYLPVATYAQASVTEKGGRWYVAVSGAEKPEAEPNGKPAVGVDLGVVQLATLSDGTVIENPKALAHGQQKIQRFQREVSRKKKGSANRQKAIQKLERAHLRVANVRRDALHKATTLLTKNHGRIVLEALDVKKMTHAGGARKRRLNRGLLDAALGEFHRQMAYKGKLYGCEMVWVNPAYTSQRCSVCGHTCAENRRSQAAFHCVSCGMAMHADLNAAKNLLNAGSCPEFSNACGVGVRRHSLRAKSQPAVKQESALL
jgi:putative transposase